MKRLDVSGKDAFHTANSLQMVQLLMVHGICKNLFICGGNNGIVRVIVVTIACLTERKKEKHLVMGLSSITVNGPSNVCMGFRYVIPHYEFLLI